MRCTFVRKYFIAMACVTVLFASVNGHVRAASPSVSVDFHLSLPAVPSLVLLPGLPVYYAPQLSYNYFFYDGFYWLYRNEAWYYASWYDGPWVLVDRFDVPSFILRIPIHYYRSPPPLFRTWPSARPPRWGELWGAQWLSRRGDWNVWEPRTAPPPASLPEYQQNFPRERYPDTDRQRRAIRGIHERYRPNETVTRRYYNQPSGQRPRARQQGPQQAAPKTPRRGSTRPGNSRFRGRE